jgi:Fusaric acid resistance protein-like
MRIMTVCGVMLTGAVAIPTIAVYLGVSTEVGLLLIAVAAGASTLAVAQFGLGGPGALIFTFAFAGSFAPLQSSSIVATRCLGVFAGAVAAVVICVLTDWLRTYPLARLNPIIGAPRPFKHEALAAGRISIGVAFTLMIAYLVGLRYPGWGAVGALAVMQGTHLHVTASRALQRTAGTVVGVLVTWTILAQTPSIGMLISIVSEKIKAQGWASARNSWCGDDRRYRRPGQP